VYKRQGDGSTREEKRKSLDSLEGGEAEGLDKEQLVNEYEGIIQKLEGDIRNHIRI